jgi:hypothetical protein
MIVSDFQRVCAALLSGRGSQPKVITVERDLIVSWEGCRTGLIQRSARQPLMERLNECSTDWT